MECLSLTSNTNDCTYSPMMKKMEHIIMIKGELVYYIMIHKKIKPIPDDFSNIWNENELDKEGIRWTSTSDNHKPQTYHCITSNTEEYDQSSKTY